MYFLSVYIDIRSGWRNEALEMCPLSMVSSRHARSHEILSIARICSLLEVALQVLFNRVNGGQGNNVSTVSSAVHCSKL